MKFILIKLRNLAWNLPTYLNILYHGVLLSVTINWPERLSSLFYLLSQDMKAAKAEPEIEAAYTGLLAGSKRMYRDHIKMRMPFHFLPSCSSFQVELGVYD